MTEDPSAPKRPAIARNLDGLRRRLRRVRVPETAWRADPRRRLVLGGAVLAAGLIVLFLFTLDQHSVAWWQGLSKAERRAFDFVTRFGKSDWLLIPSGVFCVVLILADWSRSSRRVAAAWTEAGQLVAFFFLAIAAAGILTNIVKWAIGRSRPVLFEADGVFALSPVSFDYAHVSFPSGHATTVAAALVAVALIFRGRRVAIALVGVAAAVIAVSRVGVRAHYPSDVVAGLFVGSATAYLLAHWLGRRGVGFQVQPDGSLRPKTAALRRMLRPRGGGRAMLHGLRLACLGGEAGEAAPVEKR